MSPTPFQKDALYLLRILNSMYEGLLQLIESSALQERQTLMPILVDLDAAKFGIDRVASRRELVDKDVTSDQETAEVCLDLLAAQRNLVDCFQKIVLCCLDGSKVLKTPLPRSENAGTQLREPQSIAANSDKFFRDSRDSERQEITEMGKSTRENISGGVSRSFTGRSYMVALYDFQGQEPDELSFQKGDHIQVVAYDTSGWWLGQLHGTCGLFPANYTRKMHNRHSGALSLEESFTEHSRGR